MRIIPTSVAQRWWCGLIVVARGIHKMHCSSSSSSLWYNICYKMKTDEMGSGMVGSAKRNLQIQGNLIRD